MIQVSRRINSINPLTSLQQIKLDVESSYKSKMKYKTLIQITSYLTTSVITYPLLSSHVSSEGRDKKI